MSSVKLRFMSLLSVVVVGCSDNPAVIEGFAATGAAMANATVAMKCASGLELVGRTDASGLFQFDIGGDANAPCIIRVTDGTTTLHSFAGQSGRINVTPLTELSVGKALGTTPSSAFAAFDRAQSTAISQGLPAAKAAVKSQIELMTGQTISGDMFTSTFKVGDPDDKVLDKLKEKLAEVDRPLADLVAASSQNKPLLPRVKVMGDSLSDVGSFGLKFTVQGSAAAGAGSADIWVDLVARDLQSGRLCPHFRLGAASPSTRNDCTNYAVGGGRINYLTNPSDPRSIILQLQTAAQVHGTYAATDVLLIDGGGNDAADLAGAYLGASSNPAAFQALLASLLGQEATATLLAGGASGAVVASVAYMEKLADKFADAIQIHAVDKGAKRVLVMNLPDIALTPRFSMVLAGVTQAQGSAVAGQVKQLIQSWVNGFNQKLANRFAGHASVAVLDFNTTFRAQVANPSSFGLTDAVQAACPVTGVDESGLPAYTFPTCTAAALSATPNKPSPDWWTTYLFSDGFHPTPKAHAAAADGALTLLQSKGWK